MPATDKTKFKLSGFVANIPPFPDAVQRVMTMLRDPAIQLTKVAEVVSLDQGFAGKVLRMANSAYFGLPRQVHNVTEALVLLGFANVKNVLISASVGNILFDGVQSYGMPAGKLWAHSVGAAYGAQILSRKVEVRLYSMAFSAGLLHDVGKVAIDRALGREERRYLFDLVRTMDELEAERQVVGITHAEVGSQICRKWNLPNEITEAVGCHHLPAQCELGRNLAGLVSTANICARILLADTGEIMPRDFDSAPAGTHRPDGQMLRRLSDDLPSIIASSRELLRGMSEIVHHGAGVPQK